MLNLLKCKCLFGFLWTSAIAAGLLTFIFFSFIDPAAIAAVMNLAGEVQTSNIKIYLGVFVFFWFTLNTSTYLAFYFGQLLRKMEKEAAEMDQRNQSHDGETGIHTS
ncbi:MAG: hypothetical protein JAY99_18905 [Candidatus Thiodiazotropha lotti]|uniref:Uncharacterized protein n=1 Tax=Candidatus Thiodiazotropha endoloripes TaxID=1818881 RepID=A0A1E2UR04_9GAMM|nr:hypothetical protein [Candidatus Thiodiazotropha endoloripes]MCG7900606.1 hypothetical protein [Candidatus Thiodiazotropha weberae]MCG7989991.1 hypothetical protein [Candidatus Thiodiazotropha lotti]MCG7903605.1 hypothetical protein [Candidatus Thiodiazotropha weberae]MCG7914358.1 hypothetical protein [Candidatus Thiodiazotropha weberae]MCG8001588.1 hypothetical protein [Candidatus Thiodiazotropha lotti]